jgi:hypothetical protein
VESPALLVGVQNGLIQTVHLALAHHSPKYYYIEKGLLREVEYLIFTNIQLPGII